MNEEEKKRIFFFFFFLVKILFFKWCFCILFICKLFQLFFCEAPPAVRWVDTEVTFHDTTFPNRQILVLYC